jgi:hypothetical protein
VTVVNPGYEPHAGKQQQFHDDRYEVFARLISAGTGGGKTEAGFHEAWSWTCENPGCVGYIFEPIYKMLNRILIPLMEMRLGTPLEKCPFVVQFHRTENRIKWRNGATWWLVGLDDPEMAEGPNVDFIWADEFRLIGGSGPSARRKQETAWKVFIRRLRGSRPGNQTGLWITTTPDAPGSVLYEKFEDPVKRSPNSRVYRWGVDDNPFLSEEYREEVKAAHGAPGSGLYNRFILGLFSAVAAGSLAFDSTVHVLEELPARGVIKRVVYGVDWGWSNPACILAIGLDGDDRAYVLEEFYQPRTSLETLIKIAGEMRSHWGSGAFICDRSEPRSIEEMRRAGLNAVPDGSKREEGVRELGGRFQVAGDGRPRIFVHRSCVNFISEAQVYDETKKEYDHAIDAARYALASLRPSGDWFVM